MKDNGVSANDMEQRRNVQRPESETGADDSRLDAQFSALVKRTMIEPPADLHKSVMTEIRAEKAKKRKMIYGLGAAAAAFVVVAGVIIAVRVGTVSNKDMAGGENINADAVDDGPAGGMNKPGGEQDDGYADPSEGNAAADMEHSGGSPSDGASEDDKNDALYWLGMYGATGGIVVVVNDNEMVTASMIAGLMVDEDATIAAADYTESAANMFAEAGFTIFDALDETEEGDVPLIVIITESRFSEGAG